MPSLPPQGLQDLLPGLAVQAVFIPDCLFSHPGRSLNLSSLCLQANSGFLRGLWRLPRFHISVILLTFVAAGVSFLPLLSDIQISVSSSVTPTSLPHQSLLLKKKKKEEEKKTSDFAKTGLQENKARR